MRTRTANGANKRLVLHVRLRCGSLSITTPVSLLANEFAVSKHIAKACFENVNIISYPTVKTCVLSGQKKQLTHMFWLAQGGGGVLSFLITHSFIWRPV